MLTAFNDDQLVKCSACLKYNVINANNCLICLQFNYKHLLNVINLDIIRYNIKTPEFIFLLDFDQVFHEMFFGQKSLFHIFVVVVYYAFLQE